MINLKGRLLQLDDGCSVEDAFCLLPSGAEDGVFRP